MAAPSEPISCLSCSIPKLFVLRSSPSSLSTRRCTTLAPTTFSSASRFLHHRPFIFAAAAVAASAAARANSFCASTRKVKGGKKKPSKEKRGWRDNSDHVLAASKRRTRSDKDLDREEFERYGDSGSGSGGHIPVLLGEVLDVFSSPSTPLRSFVDCTLGAAGHSSAIIEAHPEMQLYIGLDVDPIALEMARAQIDILLAGNYHGSVSELKPHIILKNFKYIKTVLSEVNPRYCTSGLDGILMDLGMSSMQVNDARRGFSLLSNGPLDMRMDPQAPLKAENILNSWSDMDIGRILRDYGEESSWYSLSKKITEARFSGGLHSTSDLVALIRDATPWEKGRHGWLKTATRVFQALRIAVNDELKTLQDSLYACFDCLAPGGRLAVISFHSLEDRTVKQTFLDIINNHNCKVRDTSEEERCIGDREGTIDEKFLHYMNRISRKGDDRREPGESENDHVPEETWIKQTIQGLNGIILTRRPITPSQEEENLNHRCRSAKLRVIQKKLQVGQPKLLLSTGHDCSSSTRST